MTETTINAKLRIIAPDDGMAITDGKTYTTGTVYLAWNADTSKWREVPESEVPEQESSVPMRRFDPYKLQEVLIREGVWGRVRTWLQANPDNWDRWVKAPDIDEDEPLLAQGIAAVKELLGWTDEQVEAVLAQAEM